MSSNQQRMPTLALIDFEPPIAAAIALLYAKYNGSDGG